MNLNNWQSRCCSAMRSFLGWLHQYLRKWGKTILNKLYAMVSFLFLILKPVLFLMLKKFFKKQMKVFIISAIEWLVLQTDNDLDDKILAKLKSGMTLGVVWANAWTCGKWIWYIDSMENTFMVLLLVTANYDWKMWNEVVTHWRSNR